MSYCQIHVRSYFVLLGTVVTRLVFSVVHTGTLKVHYTILTINIQFKYDQSVCHWDKPLSLHHIAGRNLSVLNTSCARAVATLKCGNCIDNTSTAFALLRQLHFYRYKRPGEPHIQIVPSSLVCGNRRSRRGRTLNISNITYPRRGRLLALLNTVNS